MFALVVPFGQSMDDIGFYYKIPSLFLLQKGMIVSIPLGKNNYFGLVVDIKEKIDFDLKRVKEIHFIYHDYVFLNENNIELLKWISKYYFSLIHNSLNLFFPKNIINKIKKDTFILENDKKELHYNFSYTKELTIKQNEIMKEIITSKIKKFLLFGITGSGKTEIYINLIHYYIQKNKQVLLLVPEIILSNQILKRIQKVFSSDVLIISSAITEGNKEKAFKKIYFSQAKIIIGTRSAIFYPYNNLGLIIVDEEHDNSYISDISPRYDSIEVVNKISDLQGIKILLGSGTPKINHFYHFLKDEFKILYLFDSFGNKGV